MFLNVKYFASENNEARLSWSWCFATFGIKRFLFRTFLSSRFIHNCAEPHLFDLGVDAYISKLNDQKASSVDVIGNTTADYYIGIAIFGTEAAWGVKISIILFLHLSPELQLDLLGIDQSFSMIKQISTTLELTAFIEK